MHKVRLRDGSEFGPADIDTIVQWAHENRIPRDALLVPDSGGEPCSVLAVPRLAAILAAPPTAPRTAPPATDEPLSGLIPYRNPAALTGYYLGIFSCFPVIGLVLGPLAIVLGVRGLRRLRREPDRKGTVHAWIAICTGMLGTLFGILFALIMIPPLIAAYRDIGP